MKLQSPLDLVRIRHKHLRLLNRNRHGVATVPECMQFVALSHGITLLPRCATVIRASGVVFRELTDDNCAVHIAAAYRRRNESDLLRRFIVFVKKQLKRDS